jgi:mitochondrial fission protein ELM1
VDCPTLADPCESRYFAFLAHADAIVVTNGDEELVADAVASGKPVYIYATARRKPALSTRLAELVTQTAYSRPRKKKGTIRPQQGREYLCSRLIERGLVRPPRRPEVMCERLIADGYARRFGDRQPPVAGKPLRERERVAAEVARLVGWASAQATPDTSSDRTHTALRRAWA